MLIILQALYISKVTFSKIKRLVLKMYLHNKIHMQEKISKATMTKKKNKLNLCV